MQIRILFSVFLLVIAACNKNNSPNVSAMIDKTTVKQLDVNRYLGTWYEIARFPHSFEKDLVGVTATYSLKPNGKLRVINKGHVKSLDGTVKESVGKAKIPDKSEPGKLKVSFFLFFYSDYFILEVDQTNYNWALVGSSSSGYLWILSRTPQMKPEIYTQLVNNAKKRGYDINKLITVPQK